MNWDANWRIRRMSGRDLRCVVELEDRCFPNPWKASDFHACLQDPVVASLVALDPAEEILGYLIGHHQADRVQILNLAVDQQFRRRGIATELVNHLVDWRKT